MSDERERDARRRIANEPSQDVDNFLKQILDLQVSGVEAILRKGEILNEAKATLRRHGDWQKLCAHLPFSQRHAHRFRSVAKHPILANRTFVSKLPDDVATLYLISRLAPELVEAAISDGRIHPKMTLAEARLLDQGVGCERGASTSSRAGEPKPWTLHAAMMKIRRIVGGAPTTASVPLAGYLRDLAETLSPAPKTPTSSKSSSRRHAGTPDPATVRAIIAEGLRAAVRKHHPDRGGDPETMKLVNLAVEWLRAQAETLR